MFNSLTPLDYVMQKDPSGIVTKAIIESDADVNVKKTVLDYAKEKADAAGNVVKTIIESDADVTPIDYARQNANDKLGLLEEKQGKSADELYGRTVLEQALLNKIKADTIKDELERTSEV